MNDVDAYLYDVTELAAGDGGGFLVIFPDIPGVIGIGETAQQAIADGRLALLAALDALKAVDREPPVPGARRAAAPSA
ncbi:type II toxin-antitoxin system HicB family antitoxin [Bradyrhizobium sp. SRS-191]|uniref:type II toxin-antitoxin system HicB family antitoxin n=1 Tax=Bradyrhizobium sp. SRS-191 TaxID=2962606 RepID=UPI00211DA7A6|nr:type II toxin-antitoxin system HicB family antitoxin [Bradyrhizobium sp. SRS-191]